ncbi:MAG: PKD domain-containing protein [Actinomycetota bacterium]|nr:PKD domain-containing protein [Actinomycetota bacterium]
MGASRKGATKPLPEHVITRYSLRDGPDGAGCLDTVTSRRDTPMTDSERSDNDEVWLFANRLMVEPCPNEPGTPATLTPAEVAEPFVRTIPLPAPRPRIPPGHAITGLPAYLETRGSLTHRVGPAPTELGPIEVRATGAYYVDWGDGTPEEGPFPFEGEPYPAGRIVHTYRHTGTYTVTVREAWSAEWRLGGDSGTVPGLQTQASVPLEVRQLQAVRLR